MSNYSNKLTLCSNNGTNFRLYCNRCCSLLNSLLRYTHRYCSKYCHPLKDYYQKSVCTYTDLCNGNTSYFLLRKRYQRNQASRDSTSYFLQKMQSHNKHQRMGFVGTTPMKQLPPPLFCSCLSIFTGISYLCRSIIHPQKILSITTNLALTT